MAKNVFSYLSSPESLGSKLLEELKDAGRNSVDNIGIIGNDNWLFLYEGANKYYQAYSLSAEHVAKEVQQWSVKLLEYKAICERKGIDFLPVIIPNKASILSEYYPKKITDPVTVRLKLLLGELNQLILCPVYELQKSNFRHFLFRKNDSHLTEYGNIFFVDKILKSLNIIPHNSKLKLMAELVYVDNNGDIGRKFDPEIFESLARFKFVNDSWFETIMINEPSDGKHTGLAYETINKNAQIKKKLLVFGNSFFERTESWAMAPYFCRLFSNVRFHWESGVYEEVIDEFNPDATIFQTCERFLSTVPGELPYFPLNKEVKSKFNVSNDISNLEPKKSIKKIFFPLVKNMTKLVSKNYRSKKDLSMKLTVKNTLSLIGSNLSGYNYYIYDKLIGRPDPSPSDFPVQQLVFCEKNLIKHGVTAVSDDGVLVEEVDISEYLSVYLKNGLLTKLQDSICVGKWALYAVRIKQNNIVNCDFGIVLPYSMINEAFVISCEGESPVKTLYYQDKHFSQSHWFMPKETVIGIRLTYNLENIPPYLHFDLKFINNGLIKESTSYRTQIAFTDTNMLDGLPDLKRIQRIASRNANKVSFLNGGRSAFVALKKIAVEYGVDVNDPGTKILDWGVGCGRVIRHFAKMPPERIVGIDIDKDNIKWCKTNLRGNYAYVNPNPPTSLEENTFDLIYSCSVLSHLTEKDSAIWLEEINRLLSQKGVALLSFNGTSNSASYLSRRPEEFQRIIDMDLFDSDVNHELDGFIPGKNYYRATFASDTWWSTMFGKYFKVIGIELSVLNGYQHIAVLSKKNN